MITVFRELGKCYPCFTEEGTGLHGGSTEGNCSHPPAEHPAEEGGWGCVGCRTWGWRTRQRGPGRDGQGWMVLWVKERVWLRNKGWGVRWHHPKMAREMWYGKRSCR